MIDINWNLVGASAALAFWGLIFALAFRRQLKDGISTLRAMPTTLKAVLLSAAVVATAIAQKQQKGDNGTQGLPTPRLVQRTLPQTVSDEEISQGYRLAYITNDIGHSFTMPTNAAYVGNVHIHGAASNFGRNHVDFGGWSFPFGPNGTRHSSAWWFVDGHIRFAPHDTGSEISTGVSSGVLAVQGVSRIWHGALDDGGYAICWENVFLGSGTNTAANAQIIMKDNGLFETWSNEVGRVYKRITPYDWDGDGLDNTIDSAPKTYDGDCFGTGVEWLNANCGAILSASLDAGVDYPFSVTNSPLPDKHLVIPFCNVATLAEGGFEVADFSVSMNLVLEPEGVNASSLPCEWELIEALPQMSGMLRHEDSIDAHYINPKQGGVYRFRGRCDGSPWTHANIVLPLCGASIDAVFDADMAVVASAMQTLRDTKSWYQKQDGDFGDRWFYAHNVMDYIGRVDNALRPTVWQYNQVTDDVLNEYYRMGAVATFRGVPTPVAKLGNFMAGYGTETVGVWRILRWASQFIRGMANDATGSMSWAVGEDFASSAGTNLVECTTTLATNIWSLVAGGQVENGKVFALWPNPANADNHAETLTTDFDHNRQFLSPGIVRQTPPPQN